LRVAGVIGPGARGKLIPNISHQFSSKTTGLFSYTLLYSNPLAEKKVIGLRWEFFFFYHGASSYHGACLMQENA
jgi:hypothetical protein